jgi:signal transduction histidine kinase
MGGRSSVLRNPRWAWLSWWDLAWVAFVGINLAGMQVMSTWQTVPFIVIWVSLTLVYGWRLWPLQPTLLTVAVVTAASGSIIGLEVIEGEQGGDYLILVPMVAVMFLVMLWNGRRRLLAVEDRLAAVEEVQRVSKENVRLLEQQRMFLLDASHELGTPITVALGHAELIEQATSDGEIDAGVIADDARVVVGELARLRKLAARLLLLASADNPDFLDVAPVAIDSLVMDALERWGYTPRRWRLGEVAEASVSGDRDRLAVALDALIENAVAHTATEDRIELSATIADGHAVLAVSDSGCGIPDDDLERIFDRFSRARPYRSRESGGFGLGLPTARAIAEAHGGSVGVHSKVGVGSTFEIVVPAARSETDVGR